MSSQAQTPENFADVRMQALSRARRAGQSLWWPTRGISMRPLLREGDEVFVELAENPAVAVGDLVLLFRRGRVIAHRLIDRGDDGRWVEKGDFNPQAYWVNPGEIAGRITRIRRAGRELDLASPAARALSRLLLAFSRLRLRLFRRLPLEPV